MLASLLSAATAAGEDPAWAAGLQIMAWRQREIFALELLGSVTAPLDPLPLRDRARCPICPCLQDWEGWEQRGALWQAHGRCFSAAAIHISDAEHLGPIWSRCKRLIPSTASVSLPNILACELYWGSTSWQGRGIPTSGVFPSMHGEAGCSPPSF